MNYSQIGVVPYALALLVVIFQILHPMGSVLTATREKFKTAWSVPRQLIPSVKPVLSAKKNLSWFLLRITKVAFQERNQWSTAWSITVIKIAFCVMKTLRQFNCTLSISWSINNLLDIFVLTKSVKISIMLSSSVPNAKKVTFYWMESVLNFLHLSATLVKKSASRLTLSS